jgi:RNA polymerase sigma factor (sigma-70 family)
LQQNEEVRRLNRVSRPLAVRAMESGDAVEVGPTDFAQLYSDRFLEMVRLAYLLTSSREAAHDIAQHAFLQLYRHWDRARDHRAYLRRSVVNACHSHHRRLRRQREHVQTLRVDAAQLDADEMFDAIAALPYRQRTAVVLRYWHDADDAEIATALGCREATVRSLVHRAQTQLRRVLP